MTTEETKQFLWGFRDAQEDYRQLLERIKQPSEFRVHP